MRLLSVLILAVLVSACANGRMDPVALETRTVRQVSDASKTLHVTDGMVYVNAGPLSSPTRGIRFPPETYVLEAEDDQYWYLRSPAPLEIRLRDGDQMDGRDIPGGLMIAKAFLTTLPGAGYIDGNAPETKLMVWKLGLEFTRLEGARWKKSF